ncbi:hypothetical protein ACG2LH_17050 [Zhouia sp. PK063]|uniref:hypothetical protein n=1 Tax=Zhouia sp. PK063 TaxID=3373602 RepID=UPI0037BC5040
MKWKWILWFIIIGWNAKADTHASSLSAIQTSKSPHLDRKVSSSSAPVSSIALYFLNKVSQGIPKETSRNYGNSGFGLFDNYTRASFKQFFTVYHSTLRDTYQYRSRYYFNLLYPHFYYW